MSKKEYKLVLCQDSVDPDPELIVWEKWIKIRKEETEHLTLKTGRNAAKLAMNLCENVREKKEEKVILEHAQLQRKVGVRGTPWDQPERLKQTCYCQPVYELKRTRAEIGRPSVIQHIGVPRHIQVTEKIISGSQRKLFPKLDSEYVSYKNRKAKELAASMKKIDPYKPDLQELIIIGTKPKPPPKKKSPLPNITFSLDSDISEEVPCAVYAVRINNTVLFKEKHSQTLNHFTKMQNDYWHEACDSWSYYFNCPINRVGRSKLHLQNLGTVTLRYCWRKIEQLNPDESEDQVFFFNKNENVICPGQSQEVHFTFMSSDPGTYYESWELIFINISFFDSLDNQLVIRLYADSVENIVKIKKKSQKLENIIYGNVLKNVASDLIEEIIEKATSTEPQIYPYEKLFLEADLFVMKNPVYFYHQTEVTKMKEMYIEMAPDGIWDLSITAWRAAVIDEKFDDRMKYYKLLKNSHREFLKPWSEENDLSAQKHKAVYQILGQMADKFDEEYIRIPETIYNISSKQEDTSQQEDLLLYYNSTSVRHIFYLRIYDHLVTAIELSAGVLSSLDLNRWIQFDFCRT